MPKLIPERTANSDVIFLGREEFLHFKDENTGAEIAVMGPDKVTLAAHQRLIGGIKRKTKLLRGQFCYVNNPVRRMEDGSIKTDSHGQAELVMGEREIRVGGDTFPLYPEEEIADDKIYNVIVLNGQQALFVRAISNFVEVMGETGIERKCGDEWLVKDPGPYIPPVEVTVLDYNVMPIILKDTEYCVILNPYDEKEKKIKPGHRKIVEGEAMFFLHPGEVIEVPEIIPGDDSVQIKKDKEILQINEYIFGEKGISPEKRVAYLRSCIRKKHMLTRRDGLYVQALEDFEEESHEQGKPPVCRVSGQTWLVSGPQIFFPNEKIRILRKVQAISLSQGEGRYIRDLMTGIVSLEKGSKELKLEPYQVPYEKDLPIEDLLVIEQGYVSYRREQKDEKYQELLDKKRRDIANRDKSQATVLTLDANTISRIVDYEELTTSKEKESGKNSKAGTRILYGPTTEMLGPYEHVQIFDLSGGKVKQPKQLRVAARALGPDFMLDQIVASTADHTKVQILVTYKWSFQCTGDPKEDEKIFATPDFVGYVCRSLASEIREVAARTDFETFHHNSAKFIREAVFGQNAGKNPIREFSEINLKILAVDIESVEPLDSEISQNLQSSIKTNIQIQLEGTREEANAKARLKKIESEKSENEASALRDQKYEQDMIKLIELQNENERLKKLKAAEIDVEAEEVLATAINNRLIEEASTRNKVYEIEAELKRKIKEAENQVELDHSRTLIELEIEKERQLSDLRALEFKKRVEALGPEKFVDAVRAQGQAAAVSGIKSTVFLPAGSDMNLFTSMESLIGTRSSNPKNTGSGLELSESDKS